MENEENRILEVDFGDSQNPAVDAEKHFGEVPHPTADAHGVELKLNTSEEGDSEIVPHLNDVEKESITSNEVMNHIKSPDEILDEEGDIADVHIDLSTVEMDKNNIPVITKKDKLRLKESGMTTDSFEIELSSALASIESVDDQLDPVAQDEIEEHEKQLIVDLEKQLAAASTEDVRANLKQQIDDCKEIIALLPRNNPDVQKELEEQRRVAVNVLATYQNISRKTLQQLQDDGSLIGLISCTSVSALTNLYAKYRLIGEGKKTLDELDSIKDLKLDILKLKPKYEVFSELHRCVEKLKTIDVDFIFNKDSKDSSDKAEGVGVSINDERIKKIPLLLSQINEAKDEEEKQRLQKEFNSIKELVNGKSDDSGDELGKLKDKEQKDKKWIETIEVLTKTINDAHYAYFYAYNDKNCPLPTSINGLNKKMLDEGISLIESKYLSDYNKYTELYESAEQKIEDIKIETNKEYYEQGKKKGFVNTFLEYCRILDNNRGQLARFENVFSIEYFDIMTTRYYETIKSIMFNPKDSKEYEQTIFNVNMTSMLQNNFLHHLESLRKDNLNVDWGAAFDPESILKRFYYDNEEEFNTHIDGYIKAKEALSHVIFHNQKFNTKLTSYIEKLLDYNIENKKKIRVAEVSGKPLKDISIYLKVSFADQILKSYKQFVEGSSEIYDAIKNKPESANASPKDFYNWYSEQGLQEKELSITNSLISSILHCTIGCSLIYGFSNLSEAFEGDKKVNKGLASDVVKYLFHTFSLNVLALKECKSDEKIVDFIKNTAKTIAYQSVSFAYEKDADITDVRKTFIVSLLDNTKEVIYKIINSYISDPISDDSKMENKKVKKVKKPTAEEIMLAKKQAKKLAKAKKVDGDTYLNLYKEYDNLIKTPPKETNVITSLSTNGRYFIEILPMKDTKAVIKVYYYKSIKDKNNLKSFFDNNAIDKNNISKISIAKSNVCAKSIGDDQLVNLGERWYYNQIFDESIATFNPTSKSNEIRSIVLNSYNMAKDKLKTEIINSIINNGIDLKNKSIAYKSNSKLDIKYFNGKKSEKVLEPSGINFFKTDTWFYLTYEINYDIINISDEKETPKRVPAPKRN